MKNHHTNITSKEGVNFVKTIIEKSGCFFQKIDQENDLGIDATIELLDEEPLNKSIAIQIKSGNSYYNEKTKECTIPIDAHRDYWLNYSLHVYGIVYIPELNIGYWVDLKNYLKNNKNKSQVVFKGNKANQFDLENFNNIFFPKLTNRIPEVTFQFALELFDSLDIDEFELGSYVLFRRYINNQETWEKFLDFITNTDNLDIPNYLIYYLSHIPWHPDISYTGEPINKEIKEVVLNKIRYFDREIITRLLNQIDEDDNIERGTIGQSIEAIISKVESKKEILEQNIIDDQLSIHIRKLSVLLYTYYFQKESLDFLKNINDDELYIIPDIIEYLSENDMIDLY